MRTLRVSDSALHFDLLFIQSDCPVCCSNSWKLQELLCFKMATTPLRLRDEWHWLFKSSCYTGIIKRKIALQENQEKSWGLKYPDANYSQANTLIMFTSVICLITRDWIGFFFLRDFLPRGSGIVTRRPLVLQLISATAGGCPHINTPTHAGTQTNTISPSFLLNYAVFSMLTGFTSL